MRETLEDRNTRLTNSGDRGRALLALLTEFGSSVLLAEKIGVGSSVVGAWVGAGKVSMRGAELIAEKLVRCRGEFRPDLSEQDWERAYPGRVPGQSATNETEDAKLLMSLSSQFGGVASLCAELGISIGNFHNWKSRGKIPTRKRESVRSLAS